MLIVQLDKEDSKYEKEVKEFIESYNDVNIGNAKIEVEANCEYTCLDSTGDSDENDGDVVRFFYSIQGLLEDLKYGVPQNVDLEETNVNTI